MKEIFRCDMNGVPYLFPSLKLENAEIAKVCHEISTNYGKYKGKEFIMHRTKDLDRNCCIYFVENRGYGDYNIVGKYYD
ncbi:hypothetical protein SAMN05216349_11819 [Oribacterium sp. KHPX15]|uniref:hypothetical protein n=1 Tax=Oribacterium sp. KHPX15 TaxID=1855342 RepID=UPI000895FCAB|nr:hypothetical protein [Oribacterium sp. KHPX15]SEA58938.1 hypothetical protein SAMN05216349_11819 [Oribacterium sp. KHPX15]